MERDLRALKRRERASGDADPIGMTFYPKCEVRRARNEAEARERKANGIARYVGRVGLDVAKLATAPQVERDAIAKQAGHRSPSDVTWALVLAKLERRKAA